MTSSSLSHLSHYFTPSFKQLLDHLPVAIFCVDLNKKIIFWNKRARIITGYTEEDILGKECQYFSQCYLTNDQCQLLKDHNQSAIRNHLCQISRKDSCIITIAKNVDFLKDSEGNVLGVIESFEDMRPIFNTSKRIKEFQNQVKAISDAAQDAIIMINDKGNITFWNHSASRIFGFSPEEIMNKNIHTLMAPQQYQEQIEKGFKHFKSTGQGPFIKSTLELTAITKDKKEFPIEISVSSILLHDKWHAVGIVRDITERKKLEKQSKLIEQQMYQNSRLASLGLLTAGVAHEINNPLAIIQAYIDRMKIMIQQNKLDHNSLAECISDQEEAVTRITGIISQLKIFSRPKTLYFTVTSLNKEVSSTLCLINSLLKEKYIKLEISLKACPDTFKGNPIKIQQIITNLVSNAIDAVENQANPHIYISTSNDGPNLLLQVKDNGTGIAPKDQDFIFDQFYTTKEVGQGTGLGLSISRSLMLEFGGTLTFETKFDEGTTFTATLPSYEQNNQSEEISIPNTETKSSTSPLGHILLIEDDIKLRELTKELFDAQDLKLTSAEHGKDALYILQQSSQLFDIIILDLQMPIMDGCTFLEKARSLNLLKNIKHIIILTGGQINKATKKLLDGFSSDILYKPQSMNNILRIIEKHRQTNK